MSMRQRVGRQEVEQFLIQVGRTRQPGRLYLIPSCIQSYQSEINLAVAADFVSASGHNRPFERNLVLREEQH